ncbi:flagellar hook-basal body complex protein FliE [Candidatus Borreliella tachyglossi]|uniref:Flagellar hook-basal body complex protein FliE n=1 Tax=Candidatus Borreliella tachyglossi TaxID=1964448 RepID=A0A2S1LWM3_9SPIR|nr:flagellar hook-basal body complex protein FliE [Candidatus Borreliella tachyglossi]AWG42682.1 flagellar hook-basal body complex protein FliE [Candidatus Borreliella tachyglossi]
MKIDSFFTDNNIYLIRKNPLHFSLDVKHEEVGKTFKDTFLDVISRVNDSQLNASRMSDKAILSPDSVDVHDVVIAIAKANMNLNITKAIVERSVRAYQDMISIR